MRCRRLTAFSSQPSCWSPALSRIAALVRGSMKSAAGWDPSTVPTSVSAGGPRVAELSAKEQASETVDASGNVIKIAKKLTDAEKKKLKKEKLKRKADKEKRRKKGETVSDDEDDDEDSEEEKAAAAKAAAAKPPK